MVEEPWQCAAGRDVRATAVCPRWRGVGKEPSIGKSPKIVEMVAKKLVVESRVRMTRVKNRCGKKAIEGDSVLVKARVVEESRW